MPTVARLRGRRAFAALASQGRSFRSGPVRVRFFGASVDGSDREAVAHVGYAIGKRVGGAVDRNRIRRRLRAAVSASTTPLTSGFYLISADSSVANAPFDQLVSAVDDMAARISAGVVRS